MQSSWLALEGHAILVVDDDDGMRELLRTILAAHGALVTTASSVGEARSILERTRPALIVTDLAMPGEDGFHLMEHCRHHRSAELQTLPIVALTAYGTAQAESRVLAAGFDAYFAKPVDPAAVGMALRELIVRKSSSIR